MPKGLCNPRRPAAVNLSGCNALTRALDVAAGDAAALSGTEPLLIERIDSEYARYFTPTGRPTGEWTAAIKALEAANQEVDRCAAAVAEVDDRVNAMPRSPSELAELSEQRTPPARASRAQAAADAIARLTDQVREAELIAAAAAATSSASTAARPSGPAPYENDTRTVSVARWKTKLARPPRRRRWRATSPSRPTPRRAGHEALPLPSSAPSQLGAASTNWPAARRPSDWRRGCQNRCRVERP